MTFYYTASRLVLICVFWHLSACACSKGEEPVLTPISVDGQVQLTIAEIIARTKGVYSNCTQYYDHGINKQAFKNRIDGKPDWCLELVFRTAFKRNGGYRFEYRDKSPDKEGYWGNDIIWSDGQRVVVADEYGADFKPGDSLSMAIATITGTSSMTSHNIPALIFPPNVGERRITDIAGARRLEDAQLNGFKCIRISGRQGDTSVTIWIDANEFLIRCIEDQCEFSDFRSHRTTTYWPEVIRPVPASLLSLKGEEVWKELGVSNQRLLSYNASE